MQYSKITSLNDLIESAAQRPFPPAVIVTIQPGDSLNRIILDHYHIAPNHASYPVAEASIMRFNAQITDPNVIIAGTHLRLMSLPSEAELIYGPAKAEYKQISGSVKKPILLPKGYRQEALPTHTSAGIRDQIPRNQDEQTAYYVLATLQQHYDIFGVSAGAGGGVRLATSSGVVMMRLSAR